MQGVTALGAYIGCALGLGSAQVPQYLLLQRYLLAFTCGGFAYLAGDILLHQEHDHEPEPTVKESSDSVAQLISDVIGFSVGVWLMVLVAQYE